ncbi:MAG: hypothetical protein PHW87_09675, partial [Methanothrix sp.]|nr:hypothetical protein [Methanothrix sp.]
HLAISSNRSRRRKSRKISSSGQFGKRLVSYASSNWSIFSMTSSVPGVCITGAKQILPSVRSFIPKLMVRSAVL